MYSPRYLCTCLVGADACKKACGPDEQILIDAMGSTGWGSRPMTSSVLLFIEYSHMLAPVILLNSFSMSPTDGVSNKGVPGPPVTPPQFPFRTLA
eukprot:g80036.t1